MALTFGEVRRAVAYYNQPYFDRLLLRHGRLWVLTVGEDSIKSAAAVAAIG